MNECKYCTKNPYTCGHAFDEGSCNNYKSIFDATEAQSVVQATSNRQVVGSNPTRGFTPAGCNVMWPEIEPYRTRCLAPNVIKGVEHIIKRIVVDKR